MKKLITFLIIALAFTSCYDNYISDYKFNSTYFAYQYDVRTFVVGEGMKFDIGVGLGGVTVNSKDRVINYVIDPSLITADALTAMKGSSATYIKSAMTPVTALTLLPANYYSLTDGAKFIITKGQQVGRITIRPDSASFLADPKSLDPNYVLPFVISSGDVDSILPLKKTTIIGVKYENMLFGNYWHGGKVIRYTSANVLKDTVKYYTTIPQAEAKIWVLKTTAPFELSINGYANVTSTKAELKLTLNSDGTITIDRATGSTFAYTAEGTSAFNKAKLLQNRKIFLSYKYTDTAGNICYATDTLTFRNRIRDGVNEWQDENPANY
ncbi:MAG: DUF1735 domain-containing protein [Paludibacter sp.]